MSVNLSVNPSVNITPKEKNEQTIINIIAFLQSVTKVSCLDSVISVGITFINENVEGKERNDKVIDCRNL